MIFDRYVAAAIVAFLLGACASQPPILIALPAPASGLAGSATTQATGPTVLVRPVMLPGYIDAFAVVLDRSASRLTVSPDAEWAERPSVAVSRVLRDALSNRLGPSRVLVRGDRRFPDAELLVEFMKLDPSDHALQLDARWTFVCSSRASQPRAGRSELRVPLQSATPNAVATATSEALGQFADVLAANAEACRP